MTKNFFKIIIFLAISFLIFVGYFAYFGITTSKFNSIIINQIKNHNNNLDIDISTVKLHLDLKDISIKIKTKDPKIILKNSEILELDEISSNISITSYLQNKFAIKNLSVKSKKNEIRNYINFYKLNYNNLYIILLNQGLKKGIAQINVDLHFDELGNIKIKCLKLDLIQR